MAGIKGPSIDKMVKSLHITKSAAVGIKDAMNRGNVDNALKLANQVMDGYGIESLWPEYPRFKYVNMGDTYRITLYYTGQSFMIGSWGNYVETHRAVANDGSNPRNLKYWR
jgi:hypothetical protein